MSTYYVPAVEGYVNSYNISMQKVWVSQENRG